MSAQKNEAVAMCEALLAQSRQYNHENNIWPSWIPAFTRMAKRRVELTECYEEVHGKLAGIPRALPIFLEMVVEVGAAFGPDQISDARSAQKRLVQLNASIYQCAIELEQLLRERRELSERQGFHTDTAYHVCDLIDAASSSNALYQTWLQDPLRALRQRFDLKYWPSPELIVGELAKDGKRPAVPSGIC